MWLRLKVFAPPSGTLWATAGGGLLDPSNVVHRLADVFTEAGYEWLTSHGLRDTTALVLTEAGAIDEEIAAERGPRRGSCGRPTARWTPGSHSPRRRLTRHYARSGKRHKPDTRPGSAWSNRLTVACPAAQTVAERAYLIATFRRRWFRRR